MLRVSLIVLLLLVVMAVVGDFVARAIVEQRVADAMQRELDLRQEPSVGIDSFPFTAALVRGNFDSVTIRAEGVGRGDLRLQSTAVKFNDVEFSLGQLLSGDHRRVSIDSGRGTARLTDEDLTDALEANGTPAEVEFRDGSVLVSSDALGGEVEAELAIEEGELTLSPLGAPDSIGIELPEFGGDVSYESVDVRGSVAELTLTIESRTVVL